MALVVGITLFDKSGIINRFYISFLVILIPFFIVNGILTGTFIENEVVWYNNDQTTGIRLLTVPLEDIAYGFSLIFINLFFLDIFKKLFKIRYPF
ncbi:MAG: lycopene cyclase domain-containing protein [Bacteroidales bacterium]|nr:lycopene cyclase domain-containing protein [Bacteroidales bacterium]